jgi:hypothetical protein
VILGLSIGAFTALHVAVSLLGIAAGLVVVFGLIASRRLPIWSALFLASTTATSATGFLFHSKSFGPPHVVGILSLGVLSIAIIALYRMKLAGAWRLVYVVSAVIALYLNAFVGVVQAFQKLAWLKPLAPTGSEPPFVAAQLAVLAIFAGLAILGAKRFCPHTQAPTYS